MKAQELIAEVVFPFRFGQLCFPIVQYTRFAMSTMGSCRAFLVFLLCHLGLCSCAQLPFLDLPEELFMDVNKAWVIFSCAFVFVAT